MSYLTICQMYPSLFVMNIPTSLSKNETDAQDRGNFVNTASVNVLFGNCKNAE